MEEREPTREELFEQIRTLKERLFEAEQTIEAIQSGEVDALVIQKPDGEQLYTLTGADHGYRVLVESVSEGALILSSDDSIYYCNRTLGGMLGLPIQKIVSTKLDSYVVSEGRSPLMELIEESRSCGAAKGEFLMMRNDGTLLPVNVSLNCLSMVDFEGICAVVTDLSEQKRVEEELRRHRTELELLVRERTADLARTNAELQQEIVERKGAEETLRVAQSEAAMYGAELATVMDALPAAVFIAHDVECRHMSGSRFTQELLGLPSTANFSRSAPPPERPTGFRPMKDGVEVPPDKLPVQMAARGTEIRDYEFELLFDDGESRHLLGNASPLRNVEGKVYGSVGAFVDITDRKRAEEELHKAKEEAERHAKELEALMDAVPALIWITRDPECLSMTGNRAVYEFLGMPTGVNVSKTAPEAGRPVHFKALRDGMEIPLDELPMQQAAKGKGSQDYELEYLFDDGTSKITLGNTTPLFDATGQTYGAIAAFVDITQRKRMEEELRKSRDELELRVRERTAELVGTVTRLEQLNEELQEFAFIASHDLQEPLRKIQAFGSILARKHKESLDPEGQDYMERITKAANRMSELLRALLSYSRSGTSQLSYEPVSLTEVAKDAASDLEILINRVKGTVEISELPTVEADAPLLRQLFQNFIGNSIKYRKESETPVVKIYGKVAGATCRIMIEDNGIGFDECYSHKIFKPFERLHGKNTPYSGTGMGLAICKKIVNRHGGEIMVRSIPEQGTIFIVSLPIKQEKGAEWKGKTLPS
jgi:PAS domain S-box-containing protein